MFSYWPREVYQEKHLEAFITALPHLHPASLVLIDDTDFPDLGKGRLVIAETKANGFGVWWSGRQTMTGRGMLTISQ